MEEVQGGPARGRGRGGRGTRGRGRSRCAKCGTGLDDLEDATVGGGRGGTADRGGHWHWHGRGRGREHGRGRVGNVDRQRLVDAFEDDDDYHELAALLDIPYQTARNIIRAGWRKVVYKDYQKAELATSNWQMTCKPSLEMNKKSYTTAFHHHRRGWSGTGGSLLGHGNFKLNFKLNHSPTPSKPTHHHQDCWKGQRCTAWKKSSHTIERRFPYATWLVNLDQYSLLPICATSSIPSFTGVHQRQVCIGNSGFNIFTRRTEGCAPLGEQVRRVVAPRGTNVNITLAISPDMGLVHHAIEQRTVTRATFQAFINELLVILPPHVPINEEVFIIFNGARPHLNIVVPPEFEDRSHVVMLPPC